MDIYMIHRTISMFAASAFLALLVTTQCAASDKKPKTSSKQTLDNTTVQAIAIPRPNPLPPFLGNYSKNLSDSVRWSDITNQLEFSTLPTDGSIPECVSDSPEMGRAYVFHVVHWSTNYSVLSSSWFAYGLRRGTDPKNPSLVRKTTASGDPLIYGKKSVLFIGINYADKASILSGLTLSYKISVTQGTPQNIQDLSQLVSGVLGLSSAAGLAKAKGALPARVAFACLSGTSHLPFSLNIVETIAQAKAGTKDQGNTAPETDENKDQKDPPTPESNDRRGHLSGPSAATELEGASFEIGVGSQQQPTASTQPAQPQQPSAPTSNGVPTGPSDSATKPSKQVPQDSANAKLASGQIDCTALAQSKNGDGSSDGGIGSQKSCTASRSLTSLDREWWDVSLAVSVPGVRETKYSISANSLSAKPTTHTDTYAMFDLFPGVALGPSTPIPHFAVGVPTASQPFYRPFFGMAEDLTGWTGLQRHGFPTAMNFFGGVVWMKTTVVSDSPTTAAELTADSSTKRVWKALFGIELPVSALASKLGKGASKSSNTSSSTKNQGSSTNAAQ
jgi:hypothetical protein